MRRVLALCLLFALPALAEETRLGQVQSTAGASAVYASDLNSQQLALSCDGAVHYRTCTSSTCTAVATDGYIPGDKKLFDVCLATGSGKKRIAIIPDSGTATTTCQVYAVNPVTYCKP